MPAEAEDSLIAGSKAASSARRLLACRLRAATFSVLEPARRRNDATCSPYSAIAAGDGVKMKLAGGQVLVDDAGRRRQKRLDGLPPERGVVLPPPGLVTQHLVGL